MDFIKTYSTKRGRTVGAYVQIKDGKIKVVIPRNDIVIRQIGIIEGGIGVVIQDIETHKQNRRTQREVAYDKD